MIIFIGSLTHPQIVLAGDAQGSAETELVMTRREMRAMRRELAAVLRRAEAQQEDFRRLQLSAAALIAGEDDPARRLTEARLVAALADIASAGQELVAELTAFSRLLDATLDKEEITPAERARMRSRLAGLKAVAARFNDRVRPPERQDGIPAASRILVVDDRLQVVVIAAGSVDGVGCGLGLRAGKDEEESVRLRVVAVRPRVCAAIVVEGDLGQLAVGMPVRFGGQPAGWNQGQMNEDEVVNNRDSETVQPGTGQP